MSVHFQNLKKQHYNSSRTILQTWESLSSLYPYISKLAKAILVLPHSSVPVERVFSQMQDFKTEKRNRLSTENLEISLLIYQTFHESDLVISTDMLNQYHKLWSKNDEKQNENPNLGPSQSEDLINAQSKSKEKKYILVEVPTSPSQDENSDKKIIKYVKSQSLITQSAFQGPVDPNPEIKGRNIEIEDTYIEMEADSKIRKAKEPLKPSYFKRSKPSQENQSPCI